MSGVGWRRANRSRRARDVPPAEAAGFRRAENSYSSGVMMRVWQRLSGTTMPRHVHRRAYASVVLAGGYEEAGDSGRFDVSAGDVLIHGEFEAHLNRVERRGAQVLNLRLNRGTPIVSGLARVVDVDAIVRIAEKDPALAVSLVLRSASRQRMTIKDWPDQFVMDLHQDPSMSVSEWATRTGLKPWTVSRGFKQVFGVTPEGFRARHRSRLAWNLLGTEESLATIASGCGFCDQAHMTRGVKGLTGFTPTQGRNHANGYKTRAC